MANKPFLVFGGNSAPAGGMADYVGAHGSLDEARAIIATPAHALTWWNLVVFRDDGLELVEASAQETHKPSRKTKAVAESGE